jgi:hypothetical protein
MSILIVLAAALVGSLCAYFTLYRLGGSRHRGPAVVSTLVLLAVLATAGTNATQSLLDAGLPFTAVDVIEAASYFVFGFSMTAAWALLKPSAVRWGLLPLVPLALYDPLNWVFRLAIWAIRRVIAS